MAKNNHQNSEAEERSEATEDLLGDDKTDRRTELASTLERIKTTTIEAFSKRGRVPQPLFWSLFHSEISELKRKKREIRALDEIFRKLD